VGSLQYGNERFEMDDRTLAHVQLVIVAKLRKQESFLLSWTVDPGHGSGRVSAWIDCGLPIAFRFDGSRPIRINRVWLDAMMDRSFSLQGLEVPAEADHPEPPQP
jgi:hypothetical protein